MPARLPLCGADLPFRFDLLPQQVGAPLLLTLALRLDGRRRFLLQLALPPLGIALGEPYLAPCRDGAVHARRPGVAPPLRLGISIRVTLGDGNIVTLHRNELAFDDGDLA